MYLNLIILNFILILSQTAVQATTIRFKLLVEYLYVGEWWDDYPVMTAFSNLHHIVDRITFGTGFFNEREYGYDFQLTMTIYEYEVNDTIQNITDFYSNVDLVNNLLQTINPNITFRNNMIFCDIPNEPLCSNNSKIGLHGENAWNSTLLQYAPIAMNHDFNVSKKNSYPRLYGSHIEIIATYYSAMPDVSRSFLRAFYQHLFPNAFDTGWSVVGHHKGDINAIYNNLTDLYQDVGKFKDWNSKYDKYYFQKPGEVFYIIGISAFCSDQEIYDLFLSGSVRTVPDNQTKESTAITANSTLLFVMTVLHLLIHK